MPNNSRRNNKNSKSRKTTSTRNKKNIQRNSTEDEDRVPKALRKNKPEDIRNTNTTRKGKKKKNRWSDKHPKLSILIKVIIVFVLLLCVVGAGIIAAVFFGLFGDDFKIDKEDLIIGVANSVVLDKNGNVLANLSSDEKRKIVTLDEMSPYLPKAYIAIEDKRFYEHSGVDIRRTAGAIANTILKGNSSYGGSTITQQLVKNITRDDEASGVAGIMRKVREWTKAYQVERMISKDQILELYLNILFVGGDNLHGVELGAQFYFGKSAKELDLAECAFLAGINSSPNAYNPYDETKDQTKLTETRKNKTLTVLAEMKDQGYITNEEEYSQAVAKTEAGFNFTKGQITSGNTFSYHTSAVINQVIEQVMEEKGVSREFAEKYVYSSGLTIYSTEDPTIQARVEQEFAKEQYQLKGIDKKDGKLINDHTQAGMAIIDHKTGQVVAVGGELNANQNATGWNRATQMVRQTGSSIKPIADVAPALQERIITAATVYDDVLTDFGGNYKPKDDGNNFRGLIGIREFIGRSQNVPAVKIMRELTPDKSIDYLRKMGISTLHKQGEDKEKDKKGLNDSILALAIGGITDGISPLEMATAYATIANDGVYIEPTFYTKVTDASGNVVLTPNQKTERVFSEQNAYITRSITKEPVTASYGTATYCAIKGMETCAKTGTTDDNYDRWLCGMTPYYTAACWFGYDNNEEVRYSGRNPAGQIWSNIMKDIHKNLPNANFNKPSGIVEKTICKTTGCLATSSCTNTGTEIFTSDNLPGICEGHGIQKICTVSGKIATEYCPSKNQSYGMVIPKEQLNLWKPVNVASATGTGKITEICTIHTKPEEEPKPSNTTTNNTGNTVGNTNTIGNTTSNNTTTSTGNTVGNETTPNSPAGNTNTQPGESNTVEGNSTVTTD